VTLIRYASQKKNNFAHLFTHLLSGLILTMNHFCAQKVLQIDAILSLVNGILRNNKLCLVYITYRLQKILLLNSWEFSVGDTLTYCIFHLCPIFVQKRNGNLIWF